MVNYLRKLEQLERLRSEDTPAASWLPTPSSHIGSQGKRRQSQSYKVKEFAKISFFWIFKQALHATYLLKLLDKMCKYEMDPISIVEDTERTRFCPQTDRRTDGQGETSIPPFQLRWSGAYNNKKNYTTQFTTQRQLNDILHIFHQTPNFRRITTAPNLLAEQTRLFRLHINSMDAVAIRELERHWCSILIWFEIE